MGTKNHGLVTKNTNWMAYVLKKIMSLKKNVKIICN